MKIVELGKETELITKGTTPTSLGKEFTSTGIPFLRAQNVINGKVKIDDEILFIDHETHEKELKRSHIKKGDLLLTIAGTIGRTAIVEESFEGLNCNQAVAIIRLGESKILPQFLKRFIQSNNAQSQFNKGKVTATISNLSLGQIKKLKIPLPPFSEQKKIAAILDEADRLRQLNQQLLEEYEALTQSVFLDMFGDPQLNEQNWEKDNFGNHIELLTDYHSNGNYKILSENVTLKTTKDYALMVRTTDLEKNNFTDKVISISKKSYKFLEKSKVFGGEIIINKIGSAGKVYLMPNLNRPVSLGMNAFMIRLKETLNNIFTFFLLKTRYGEYQLQKRVKGAVTKTIRKDAVKEIPLIIPPINLQTQFATRIENIEKQKAQVQAALTVSEDLFNSLLQKAFKGELTKGKV